MVPNEQHLYCNTLTADVLDLVTEDITLPFNEAFTKSITLKMTKIGNTVHFYFPNTTVTFNGYSANVYSGESVFLPEKYRPASGNSQLCAWFHSKAPGTPKGFSYILITATGTVYLYYTPDVLSWPILSDASYSLCNGQMMSYNLAI